MSSLSWAPALLVWVGGWMRCRDNLASFSFLWFRVATESDLSDWGLIVSWVNLAFL